MKKLHSKEISDSYSFGYELAKAIAVAVNTMDRHLLHCCHTWKDFHHQWSEKKASSASLIEFSGDLNFGNKDSGYLLQKIKVFMGNM